MLFSPVSTPDKIKENVLLSILGCSLSNSLRSENSLLSAFESFQDIPEFSLLSSVKSFVESKDIFCFSFTLYFTLFKEKASITFSSKILSLFTLTKNLPENSDL